MKVTATRADIASFDADTVVVNLLEGVTSPGGATGAVDRALDGAVADLVTADALAGASGRCRVLFPRAAMPAERVIVVGLGPVERLDAAGVRSAAAAAARSAHEHGAERIATVVHGAGAGGLDPRTAARATVEGTLLALGAERTATVTELVVVEHDAVRLGEVAAGAELGSAMAEGTALARALVRGSANEVTPEHLAEVAADLARAYGAGLTVGDRAWIVEQGMGALAAVASGAGFEPRFIVLDHDPSGDAAPPIVLVGKGITFDSGGLTIKTRTGMAGMNRDMAGAAAVLGAMKTLGELGYGGRVVAVVPATENVIDAKGFRPTDVVRTLAGLTVEIVSTDAEGRLILADALAYAARLEPRTTVDIATLTGGVVTALGSYAAGLFTGDDELARALQEAARATGERLWRLPLWSEYRDGLRSDVADLKNSTGTAPGSACVAAAFLQRFAPARWAHLDIAGVHWTDRTEGERSKGPTGFGVRLLADWLVQDGRGTSGATV